MRNGCQILFLIFCFSSFSQNIFLDNCIYLVCRGTNGKRVLIAEKFNLINKKVTHIGVGYVENHKLKIFNVSMTKTENKSALLIESFSEFKEVPGVFYVGVWRKGASLNEINNLKRILKFYENINIKFDNNFVISDDSYFYCSEFVVKVLNELFEEKINPSTIELTNMLRSLTSKKEFVYYPVDFFSKENDFTQVYEECN